MMFETHVQMEHLISRPLKRVNPDDFEVQYLLMKSIWNLEGIMCYFIPYRDKFSGIEGISAETLKLADNIQNELDEELAHYYKYTLKLENVASRIYKLHNLLTGIVVSQNNIGKKTYFCLEMLEDP